MEDRLARWCSAIAIALTAIVSIIGLLVHGVYNEAPWAVAALRGNDLVTLSLVVPVLGIAVARGGHSQGWRQVWLGGLFYGVYNFAYYAFGTAFNDIFLLHVATISLSLTALVALVAHLDTSGLPLPVRADRTVAVFMILVGSALLLAWGGLSLRFALTGELPHDVMPPSAVHLVYALDMSLLAPAFLAGGVLLLRRRPWGRVLGVAVNAFGAAYLVVLEVVGGFQANAGIDGKTWVSVPAIAGALLCASACTWLLTSGPSALSHRATSGDGERMTFATGG
jgi:hypothetical protein